MTVMSRVSQCLFLLLSLSFGVASGGQASSSGSDEDADRDTALQTALEVVAREAGVDRLTVNDVSVLHVARINWPNSALGCPKPGQNYLQVITPGYVVLLQYRGENYRVHVAGDRGLICTLNRMATPARVLPYLELMARKDLSKRLGLAPEALKSITVVEAKPMAWPDAHLGCGVSAGNAGAAARPIKGFALALEYQGRRFDYRTSQTKVMPCPSIESR